jgi:hypothetical protein
VLSEGTTLFANTAASATLYSIITTAKAYDLTPFNYLMHLLEELPKIPEDIESLMSWDVLLEKVI